MANTDPYAVTIVNAMDQPFLTPTGVIKRHVVTYKVGDRGPFTIETTPEQASDAYISSEIAKRVSTLRQLDNRSY